MACFKNIQGPVGWFLLYLMFTLLQTVDTTPYTDYGDFNQAPYSDTVSEELPVITTPKCKLMVNPKSALHMKGIHNQIKPDFERIELRFNHSNITSTEDVILPFNWIWTFYDWSGMFSYTKWPYDFSLLSFGLLDAKTVPFSRRRYLLLDVVDASNCSFTIGEKYFDIAIALALKNLTRDYLIKADKRVSFSYWCYLKAVPNVSEASYQASLYLNYPTEFSDYYCCHTEQSKDQSDLMVYWNRRVTRKMFEIDFVPFIMSLVAFAFFPMVLLNSAHALAMQRPRKFYFYNMLDREDQYNTALDDTPADKATEDDIVYLNGDPPLSITSLFGGMCGLVKKYPFAVSRFHRLLFITLSPCLLYIRILAYRYDTKTYATTMKLLQYNFPMGYLSVLAGFEESPKLFLPALGGPIVVLVGFHIIGLLFIFIPRDLIEIVDAGCNSEGSYARFSPLFYGIRELEIFSLLKISRCVGYAKARRICMAGVYMMFSPRFWWSYMKLQYWRCVFPLKLFVSYRSLATILCFLILPLVVILALTEVCVILLVYGLPIVNFMRIVVRGFLTPLLFQSVFSKRNKTKVIAAIMGNTLVKILLTTFFSLCLIYLIFGFCTIFIDTFMFVSKILVFCFIAVVVYPSSSFGYLFFGIIFVYYVFKMFQKLGDGYFELLFDAVEISSMLERDPYRSHVINGTLVVEDTHGSNIDRIQLANTIVNLTHAQREQLKNVNQKEHTKVVYKNNVAGIPRSLFEHLVKVFRPVHIEIANIVFKLLLIVALISVSLRVIVVKPVMVEGMSEIMHTVFIMAIGAIPRVIEVAADTVNHSVKKDIQLREMKSVIIEYWRSSNQC